MPVQFTRSLTVDMRPDRVVLKGGEQDADPVLILSFDQTLFLAEHLLKAMSHMAKHGAVVTRVGENIPPYEA